MKKSASLFISACILFVTLSTLVTLFSFSWETEKSLTENLETAVSQSVPFREKISALLIRIRYLSGVRTFDGIYIGSDGSLLREVEKPTSRVTSVTKNNVSRFAEKKPGDTYFTLIPTSIVIRQQSIASYAADGLYNQRHYINSLYSDLDDSVSTVDIYQSLFSRRLEYIYYHTEDLPTSLGGYYIYEELASRMGLKAKPTLSFSTAYVAHGFTGSLATEAFLGYAEPDFLTFYEDVSEKQTVTITHADPSGNETEQSGLYLYDPNLVSDKTDLILGGLSAVTTIKNEKNEDNSLLVFCDETAKSWLPFLAGHYGTIVAVDLNEASDEQLSALSTGDYSQVLFAYGFRDFSEGIDFSRLELIQ